mgnify:CR=1 FL=1
MAAARAGRGTQQRNPRRRGFASSPEEMLLRQRETNEFLTAFIDGTLERDLLRVREKQYWERLVNMPPEIPPNTRESIFLEDPAGETLQCTRLSIGAACRIAIDDLCALVHTLPNPNYWSLTPCLRSSCCIATTSILGVHTGSFKRLLLAGRQFDLVIFHAAVYALFDMRFRNTFVAIFATYVADLLVRGFRHHMAVRNIARKTLLDPRFLL